MAEEDFSQLKGVVREIRLADASEEFDLAGYSERWVQSVHVVYGWCCMCIVRAPFMENWWTLAPTLTPTLTIALSLSLSLCAHHPIIPSSHQSTIL
jgi:hypothetical protein